MYKIYLDNCCYNRPFDDRSIIINYLEREAILIIMQMAHDNELQIIGSNILSKEMGLISNPVKKKHVIELYQFLASDIIDANSSILERATEIRTLSSIKMFDSLHLACAEARADVLLTTDKKFLKAARKLDLTIKIMNPIEFLLEVSNYDNDTD